MLSGYLQKRGKLRQNWKRRYFALKGHTLSCYADARPGRGVLCAINLNKLDACGPDEGGDDDGVFSLSVPQGAIKLRAASAADRDAWVSAIAAARRPPPPPTATPGKFLDAAPPPPTATPSKFRVAVASPDAVLASPAAVQRRPPVPVAAAVAALEASPPRVPSGFKALEAPRGPADPAYAPSFATVAAAQGGADMASEALATVVRDHDADDDDELTVSAGDVVSVKLARGAWAYCEETDGWVLVQKGADQGLVPFDCLTPGVETSADLGRGGVGRGGDTAPDRDLSARAAAKYDTRTEALARRGVRGRTRARNANPVARRRRSTGSSRSRARSSRGASARSSATACSSWTSRPRSRPGTTSNRPTRAACPTGASRTSRASSRSAATGASPARICSTPWTSRSSRTSAPSSAASSR